MKDRPFAEEMRRLYPEEFDNFLRAVERERREGELLRMLEEYGRPVRFYSIEEVSELKEAA